MRSQRSFFETFPEYVPSTDELKDLLTEVSVTRVLLNSTRSKVGIYIDSPHIIHKDELYRIRKELEASMPDAQALTLDLKNLEYISSAGLRVLLAAHKTMAGKSGMKLTNVNEIVKEVLDITDFSSILTIE